jgi:lipopolysaccharide transport system permease protein
MTMQTYTKDQRFYADGLNEIFQYRELFFFLVWRDIKVRYKQTVLGAAWAIIQPFFLMVVFTLFFGRLAKMPSDGIPYPIFSYSALVPWTYVSVSVALAGNSLVGNANLLTKVYFPRIALPASSVLAGAVDFAIASTVLIAMMIYYDVALSWELLLWPVLLVPLMMLTLGVGMILAALNVKYRDVKYAIPFALQLWLFVTPIIYPTSIVPERMRFLVGLNPLTGIIEAFRASLLPNRYVDWELLLLSMGITLIIFVVGALYFYRTERYFADLI